MLLHCFYWTLKMKKKFSTFIFFLLSYSASFPSPIAPLPAQIATDTILQPIVDCLEDLALYHQQHPEETIPIAAIGGCPGVGKTFFTRILAHKLEEKNIRFVILPLDDFNLPASERQKLNTSWDVRHLQVQEVHRVLREISIYKKKTLKPIYNQLTGESGVEILDLENVDLILLEGHYALNREAPLHFFDYCTVGIYLEASKTDIYQWKWERELKKKTPRSPEFFAQHMQEIFADFDLHVSATKDNAFFLVTKDSDHTYHIEYAPYQERKKNKQLEAIFTGLSFLSLFSNN
jgi:uridine kinase